CSDYSATTTGRRAPSRSISTRLSSRSTASPTSSTATTVPATASSIGIGRSTGRNRRWMVGARCLLSSASTSRSRRPDMCTSIIELARAEGMAKRGDEWFPLSRAVVAYDHARHAPLGDVITLDFINTALEPGARAGVELTLETAKELRAALDRAIAAAEFEEAEVRGKGAERTLVLVA